jgi:DNA-binding CsgD family transcriptional regulator
VVALTPREAEVLRWTGEGKTSTEIGKILHIAERTVNFHVNKMLLKLNATNKVHAVAKAISAGLLDLCGDGGRRVALQGHWPCHAVSSRWLKADHWIAALSELSAFRKHIGVPSSKSIGANLTASNFRHVVEIAMVSS